MMRHLQEILGEGLFMMSSEVSPTLIQRTAVILGYCLDLPTQSKI